MGLSTSQISEDNIFSSYVEKKSIFKDKDILNSTHIPDKIIHREQEINHISSIIAPLLRNYSCNNVFIFGTTGTGKTISTKFVINQLENAGKQVGVNLKCIYVNCKLEKVSDTEYRLLAQLLRHMGDVVPSTGLPTEELYNRFFRKVDEFNGRLLIVLDEIDTILKKMGDDFLYNITRKNSDMKISSINIIGITNNITFKNDLDIRVKSSLSDEEILFKPYNANQLVEILKKRSNEAFEDHVVSEGVIEKCAAVAAQEHGDARKALDLLRVSAEVAERQSQNSVTIENVSTAERKIDIDSFIETVKSQPTHSQLILFSIMNVKERKGTEKTWADKRILTGDVFNFYDKICGDIGMKRLTQRRLSDLISELNILGVINTTVISKGRYGRMREIILKMDELTYEKIKKYLSARFG